MKKKKLNPNFNQKRYLTNFKKFKKTKNPKFLKNIFHLYISAIKPENLFYKIEESKFALTFKAKLILDKNKDFSDKEIIELCQFICFLEKSKNSILDQLDLNDDDDQTLLDSLNEDESKEIEFTTQNDNKQIKMGFKISSE